MNAPEVTVNGRGLPLGPVAPHTTALDWLREQGLTGSKEGCAEGECGACAVMVARPATAGPDAEPAGHPTEWVAINACLVPVGVLDGQEVLTAEGLGTPDELHPVQYEMAVRGGSQCGYCTPGFVCSMAAEYYRPGRVDGHGGTDLSAADGLVRDASDPNAPGAEADAEHGPNGFDLHALSGNLCRCTGYRPIRDAAYCLGTPPEDDGFARRLRQPPPPPRVTRLAAEGAEFLRPESLADVLGVLAERPDALLVAGSTDWGVEVNIRGVRAPLVVAIDRLTELRDLRADEDGITLGAALTLTEIERRLDGSVPLLAEVFPQFASRLIRNGATIGGNLGTGSPIGDLPPALLALEAELVLASGRGERRVPLAEYFTGYRQTVRAADELIKEIRLPLPLAPLTAFHKIAKRRFDDISSVAVAFAIELDGGTVARAAIGLGGVAATPIRASATEAALAGRPWSAETAAAAAEVLAGEGTPLDDHRASARYRAAMLGQSLLKLHATTPEGASR